MIRSIRLMAAAAAIAVTTPAFAVTEIQWWHAMTGGNNDIVNALSDEFNKSQSDYKVVPTYKGPYPETMNAGIAAFRAGGAPHIMQVFEVGTATMMSAKGAIKPVHELMKDANEPFDPKAYLPAITGYYSTAKGEMLSFPFNSSSMVMWVNQDALKKAECRDPEDMAGSFRRGEEAEGGRSRHLRFLECLGDLGTHRAVLRLAQRGDRHQGQRSRRFRHRTEIQFTAACEASRDTGRAAERQDLRLLRPRKRQRRRASHPASARSS